MQSMPQLLCHHFESLFTCKSQVLFRSINNVRSTLVCLALPADKYVYLHLRSDIYSDCLMGDMGWSSCDTRRKVAMFRYCNKLIDIDDII